MLDGLARRGFRCVGPQLRDGTIVYDDLTTIAQLPVGISDDQAPGTYVARKVGSPRCFAWANGPQALKPFLFAPQEPLWRAERRDGHIAFTLATTPGKPLACIGVRACDLAALALQDAHFLQLDDPYYAARRENLFIVAVDCTHPAP
ncbi:MAG: sulfite reductase subunit A, partial [Pseudomonadota bacterium]